VNAFTHGLAMANAKYGIRVNAILPGLMNTPMAIESISQARQVDKQSSCALATRWCRSGVRWARVDVANAALFLASDDAAFITGVLLPSTRGKARESGSLRVTARGRGDSRASAKGEIAGAFTSIFP